MVGCLILDVRMPGITGVELHDVLLKEGIDIPVIFITGHGSVSLAVKSMKKEPSIFLKNHLATKKSAGLLIVLYRKREM